MKNRNNRITRKLALAALIAGFGVWLSLSAWRSPASASAQTATLPAAQGEQAIERLKEQGLYDSLEGVVAAARYELHWEDQPALSNLSAAYHAPNLAQRMSAYFTPAQLHLSPHRTNSEAVADSRASGQPEWRATMKLVGYGYGDNLAPVGDAEIAAHGARIEYRRAWLPLTEWYINKASGLEQGFTLAAPPNSKPEGERLRLVLELSGDLRPELTKGGEAIALKQADGKLALRYGNLYDYDANGRMLPSQMKLSKGRVELEVEDAGAAYPVTIDPTFAQQQVLAPSNETIDHHFGSSVAILGDTVVVGAPSRALIEDTYRRRRIPCFGCCIYYYRYIDPGKVYVFVRSGGAWSLQQKLTASDRTNGDFFGSSVAISGDASGTTVVIGAPQPSSLPPTGGNAIYDYAVGRGAAYVFVRDANTWNQQRKLSAPDGAAGDKFGYSVALSSNSSYTVLSNGFPGQTQNEEFTFAVVGAPFQDIGANQDQGSVYVFKRKSNSTGWGPWPPPKLTAGSGGAGDRFGSAVAVPPISARYTVVGAPYGARGSAYVFVSN